MVAPNFLIVDTQRNDLMLKDETLPRGTKITSSSLLTHPTLHKPVFTRNHAFDFICHTKDNERDPSVVFELPDTVHNRSILVYNRSGESFAGRKVAQKILGTNFSISLDGTTWKDINVELNEKNVYGGDPIILKCDTPFRYFKLFKTGIGQAIHISQVLLVQTDCHPPSFDKKLTAILADCYSLRLSSEGRIFESSFHKEKGPTIEAYRTENCPLNSLNLIAVASLGRFGNAIIQLGNAIDLAKLLGVNRVYLLDKKAKEKLFLENNAFHMTGVRVQIFDNFDSSDVYLKGKFFYRDIVTSIAKKNTKVGPTIEKVLPFLSVGAGAKPQDQNVLTIHIRSGDVFSFSEKVHPSYGQPPLAYYKMVIEKERPKTVILVFEDRSNPVIDALVEYCDSSKVSIKVVSGELKDDLDELLKAHTVVAGQGTFIPVVAALSKNIKKIYSFEKPIDAMGKPHISNTVVVDQHGAYRDSILRSNWHNTPEQRELMLTYPASKLNFQ